MSHPCTVADVPRPSPSYPDTLIPDAATDIAARMRAIEDALDVVAERRKERDESLRHWYAEGVDTRDLVRATSAEGTLKPVSKGHVSRLVSGTPRKPRTANP